MNNNMLVQLLDFAAKIAWPIVVLVAICILGPGGLLQKIIKELAGSLFRITDSVNQFKATVKDFHATQTQLQGSTDWVVQLQESLDSIASKIEIINVTAQDLVISEGNRKLETSVNKVSHEPSGGSDLSKDLTTDDMFSTLRNRWEELVEKLKTRVGAQQFDARMVGQMAWILVDKRKSNPLTQADAELFERLQAQMKRFIRLQRSKDEWLTSDTFGAFIRALEQAEIALERA